jgi:carbamoyl-phosphate synthase large subunit
MAQLGLSGQILAADVTIASPAYHRADRGIILPPVGDPEYLPALLDAVSDHRVGLLVPLTDLDLRLLAGAREPLAQRGCTAMIGGEQAVAQCQDKARTNELLKRAGLPVIRTLGLEQFQDSPFYPCFVKPAQGSAGVGTGLIENPEQLRAHVAVFGSKLLVQDYIPGQEYTLDVYRSRSGQVCCVVPRQRLAVRSGEVEKGITVRDPVLIQAAVKLAGVLEDLWGVFCCQCRRSGSDATEPPWFFEINPRFGGGAPLSIAAGANLPLYLLQELLGLPITARLGEFTDRLLMLRYDESVFVKLEGEPDALPGYQTPTFR